MPDGQHRDLSADLAQAAGELLVAASASETLAARRLVDLAARHVPGCCGATTMLWHDGEAIVTAASHPDLSGLIEVQQRSGRGPSVDALASGVQVACADTLGEQRWPEFASLALALGVRCSLTLVQLTEQVGLTLSLYATRPHGIDPDRLPMGELLIEFGGAAMRTTSTYRTAERTARQLTEGADSRALVDQAKGILMASLSCSAKEALGRMRQISQTTQIKVTEVARRIVESHELDVS